jgi:DNA-binding IclR family transcriptional regulator
MVMRREKSEYSIQAVDNVFRLLEAFDADEEIGVTELAVRLKLHKNNVFRILATLTTRGYVEKNEETDRYRLGPACLVLGQAYSRRRSLLVLARRSLRELAEATGESAHLGVLADFEVIHLDGEPSERLVATGLRVGRRLPAHCTALGKVLLGCADPKRLEAYDQELVARGRVAARTPATLVDREKLVEHLRAVRAQGYAIDLEECETGLCCASAPVYDAGGHLVAALSVSGPAFRLDPEQLAGVVVPEVVRSAEKLSRALGAA